MCLDLNVSYSIVKTNLISEFESYDNTMLPVFKYI